MKKSELYGSAGSMTFMVLLLLFLFLLFMPGTKMPEEEGIMVSFGDAIEGGGPMQEVQPETKPVETSPPPASATKPVKQDLMTQDDNSLAIAEQKKKEREAREAAERERKEQARIEAERKRKEQEAIDKANALMGGMGSNTGSTGSGSTSGNTSQGNPLGSGSSGGNSWSLNGRSLSGRLVQPSYNSNEEGRITVNIRVDANGNVTSASVGSPTNISSTELRNAAISAAKATKFTSGNGVAAGTITYNFRLR
ncbi:MAG: TonB family protein [Paludibacter sp.]|nr:TonB family protein [Paludibacter sp.]MBP8782811.1 TonB family protein [Paludibacter sp.]MDX9920382.1 TonB family protein [Paludibacter sp.]